MGRSAEVLLERHPLVLVDDERLIGVGPAQLQDVGQSGGRVLPNLGRYAPDHHLVDLEHLTRRCQLGVGLGDRHQGHAMSSSRQDPRRSRTWAGLKARVSGRTASAIWRWSQ